jgi:tetratricopeptide (TPR) repeat protein
MWLRTGLSVVLQSDLVTASHITATSVDSQSQAYQSQATQVLQATLERRDQQWRLSMTTIDLASQMIAETLVVTGPETAGVIPLANAAALRLDSKAAAFSTRRDPALQLYVQGMTASSPTARIEGIQKAIELDPRFGLAYISGIDILAQQDTAAADDLLRRASVRKGEFTALDQARLNAVAAHMSHSSLAHQVAAAEALLKLTPNSLDALVNLASLRFSEGDVARAKQLSERALRLSPGNETVRIYLALGLFGSRQFREAERVFQSLQANPAILPQLAVCVLLEGDAARADEIYGRYLKTQQSAADAVPPLARANWLALTGKVQDAVTLLNTSQLPHGELQSLALSQLAVLEMMRNNRLQAQRDASASLAAASSAFTKSLAIGAKAISSDAQSAASVAAAVNATALGKDEKAVVVGYGLFLNGYFSEAADAWKAVFDQSGGTDIRSRVMLAASLDRAGRHTEQKSVPIRPFMPNLRGGDEYAPVAFAEVRRLLGR